MEQGHDKNILVWVLADDRAGNVGQALGVAESLQALTGIPFLRQNIAYTPLARLPNALKFPALGLGALGVKADNSSLSEPPWPDLVISAGRRTAPVARWIKQQSGGQSRVAHIMWPGSGFADLDLIAIPKHDARHDLPANTKAFLGSPHRVTVQKLAEAKAEWAHTLGKITSPRLALIVGGSTKNRIFTPEMAQKLGQLVRHRVKQTGGSLLLTTSRRTGEAATAALLSTLPRPAHIFRWGEDAGENPYFGYLAWADQLIVTGESMSMCSEACGSGKPLHIFAPGALITPKHARLHADLYAAGYAHPLGYEEAAPDTPLPEATPSEATLNAANDIAREIIALIPTLQNRRP